MTPINVAFLLPIEEIIQYHKDHCAMEELDYVDDDDDSEELTYLGFSIMQLQPLLADPNTAKHILSGVAWYINDFAGTRSTDHDCLSHLTLEGMREFLDYNCTYAESTEDAMALLITNYLAGGLGINAIYERLPDNLQRTLTVDESTGHFVKCRATQLGLVLDVQLYIKPAVKETA